MIAVNLDVSAFAALASSLEPTLKKAIKENVALLVAQARAHIVEQASQKLHTRRAMYVDALSHFQVDENTWIVSLSAKACWIEEGLPPGSMLDGLLKSKSAKRAKDGSIYVVVPFEHKKGPTQLTPAQASLTETLRATMKQKKIPYGNLEKGPGGSPKLGLLHSFDINSAPMATQGPWGGHSQGKGPLGAVQQGPTGIPLLQGVRVYQREVTDKATGKKSVKKSIVTFRIASSKHRAQGRWEQPGQEPLNLFDDAKEWAEKQWADEMVPAILAELEWI